MEGKQQTPSVIARLMGLDELPPQLPLSVKKRKVLSENYLQKTASIGLREKSSFQKHLVVKDVPGVEMLDNYSHEKMSQNAAKSKMQKYTDSSFTSIKEKHSYFKGSDGTKQFRDLQTSKPYCHSVHSAVAKPIGKISARITAEENTSRSLQTLEIGTTKDDVGQCSTHLLKKINFQFDPCAYMPHPSTRTIVVKPSSGKYHNTRNQSFSKRSSFSKESKKQIIERSKLMNDLQEVEIARRSQSIGEMLATDDLETRPQFLDSERDKHSFCSSFSVNTEISGSCNSPIPNHSAGSRIASGSPEGAIGHKASLTGWYLRQKLAVTEKHSKSMNQKLKDNMEYRDLNSKETDQHSPNSVLEPRFQEEKSCTSELRDLCSVAVQLHFLETNSEETYSEGSEMGVSSDGDSERGSHDVLEDSENILKDFKTAEGRDFSYLVDVLDEAGLHGMNLGVYFETWNSSEYPLSPLVFDLLEKKYGKQTFWLKSERKLLFDHINAVLSEISHSFLDIYVTEKSLKRRCCSTMRRIDVEEELWRMLVSQENEVHKDLSGKAIGNETKWLQADEEIGSICREIEEYLFDELAAELALH
ncbi:uncharacterized protein LOC132640163 [Lycium barbarum]|uniref:uncharacterized protein LOC132640163 n=1 Tax=Lycium barbarum TaxID=112863 RepID=UPI00293E84DE|nr:uncharacterized protein LOC132640163 [Lycium barbarum]XP_060212617.1 uncharacterized protein LOC132640163 [Lycium barbarum]